MSIRRTAPALAISLATHTAAVLAVAATLPVMVPTVLVVELDPLKEESRAAPQGGPSAPAPSARSAPTAVPRRSAPTAAPAPTPMPSAPVPATPVPATPPPTPVPDVEAAPAPRAEVPVVSADVAPPPPIVEATHAPTGKPDTAIASAASGSAAALASHDGAPRSGRPELDRGSAGGTASSAAATDLAHATGGGAGNSDGYGPYLALLRHRIQSVLQYPMTARRRGLTGTVHVEIAVQPSGAIDDVAVIASSRHRVLDDAAVDAVRALGRVPFPPGVEPRALRARLPIVFELQ